MDGHETTAILGRNFYSRAAEFSQTVGIIRADNDSHCNYYRPKNSSHLVIIPGGYEGIPQNLTINVIAWICLIILFSVLRKNAWNYGRMALLQRRERRETAPGYSEYNIWTQIFYRRDDQDGDSEDHKAAPSFDPGSHYDHGMFSWILAVFRIKDDQIRSKCGDDAVQYLSFQRHIIVMMSITMVVSLAIALPINMQGDLKGDEKQFGHTTLSNLDPRSWYLWILVGLSLLFVPLAIFIMRHFSKRLDIPEEDSTVSRTLMINHIPRSRCNKADLLKHFNEAYPEYEVIDIQFAYDLSKLIKLDRARQFALHARNYSVSEAMSGNRMLVRPFLCGNVCVCCDPCCPKSKIDAAEYYTSEERQLASLVDQEKLKAIKRPVGVAFVTFASNLQAARVRQDHRPNWRCGSNPGNSSLSVIFKPHRWSVDFAPRPDEINWGNLAIPSRFWYLRSFLINSFLFIVLFFLTTPAVVVNTLDIFQFSTITSTIEKMSPVLSQFLPTLLLWTTSALMPVMVAYSDEWMSHWTKSTANHTIMRKTFIFLMFMVVILPSLGLTSAQAFFEWATRANGTYRWECVFLPDNGAFFVNYVITSSFIGTALELMRFAELFLYACKLSCAMSRAEVPGVRRNLLWEFNFGVQYAWTLLNFSLITMYSVSCPLITPFGFVYVLLKHFVDRYNIFFAYAPSRINKNIHTSAINFVMIAFLILQLTLFFFSMLRYGLKGVTIFALVGFCATLFLVVVQASFRWFRGLAPISYRVSQRRDTDETDLHDSQLPPTAEDLLLAESNATYHAGKFSEPRGNSNSPGRQRVDSFSTVNSQGHQNNVFLPEVLTESQCNGPAHLMETIATTSALDSGRPNKNSINGEMVTVEQPIPCRDRPVPPEQVYSYQKYNTDQEHI
ncbi:calcium permeable stress-gated cation channel 1-like isoform X1 [Daphnia carinata]|uniref:calcium permeable stress-gated cation channel 1-like isoform X1 n=1 Tax=Daphnia carinata TaxID=120202 RepID=UPI00257C648D|nr:calcium permeable stress-gated cation channel 1-like isoform X1 [Daphnia carinata]